MTDQWGSPAAPKAGTDQPVSILIAVNISDPRSLPWQQSIQMDARFRLAAIANDAKDLQNKLAASPEVILLDARVFDGPAMLIESLTGMTAAVYVILPGQVASSEDVKTKSLPETLKAIPCVKQVYLGDMNISDLLARAYGDALALRKTIAAPNAWSNRPGSGAAISGMRIITVWNRAGGVGRTTIAAALAQATAHKGLRSLLIGLDAPDVMPLHLGLKSEPNITAWFSNPTDNGLRAATQTTASGLDVVAGFPDIMAEASGDVEADDPKSINKLVVTASYAGYAGIFLDTPAGGIAGRAVSAANTWVLVARPTLADAWAAVEAFRTVTQRAAGQHRINPGNIFVVLNMRGQGMLSPNDWHQAADQVSRKLGLQLGFPPVAAVIPFLPGICLAQDAGRPALETSDEFARPIHLLADMLFGGQQAQTARNPAVKKGFSIKIKK